MRNLLIATSGAALLLASPAYAEKGDWLVRLRAIVVAPNEKTGPVQPTFATSHTAVDNSVAPEIDFTYMATKHVGAELILATTKHHVSGKDALAPVGRLAGTWVLPPTLTLQYHFLPDAAVRPYFGAGANYTIFYNTKSSGALNKAIGATKVRLRDSFGYALQAGVDMDLSKRVFLNLDVKYIDIDTKARLKTGSLINRERVHLDPLVFGIGIGTRF
ncbi:OmpW/AlkL family protein [Sphingomonas sp.]|uniref:OmpW/AlkL family protein n=1 Tax=Sphingomonas sp. TaxID=28214 RepID=UPI003B3BAC54